MEINKYIFRNYDIRGKVGEDLDEEKVEALGKAYGTLLHRRKIGQAVVGRDSRISGPKFQEAFIKGLISTGVDVIDIGEVMTQMMYFAQYYYQTNGGAMLTASHNPAGYNGFKLAIGFSKTTEQDEVQEIRMSTVDEIYYTGPKKGKVTKGDVKQAYIKDLQKRISFEKKFKIVLDSRHGTSGMYMPEILRLFGCEVIELHTKVDGSFPAGTPDPTDAHIMNHLAQVVMENHADLGVSFDGDGDRIGVTDEQGHVLWNDVLIAIYAEEILERFPKSKIVYNTLCTQLVSKSIIENGGIPIIWKTGHAFIKSKVSEEAAVFGGELSGHFFFNDNAYGHDDGSYAILRLLEILSDKNKTLSETYLKYPQYISSPEIKIGCPDSEKIRIVKEISEKFKKDLKDATCVTDDSVIPGDDGVRADFADGMIVFRYSQNGPYVTIKFEAKDEDIYLKRKKYIRRMLENYPEMIWKDELCINLDALN
jgi:phosphomannomutase/phosphoglucomutase